MDHLDAKVKESWETKQGILATLSQCVAVAADSSLGESVEVPVLLQLKSICTCTHNNCFGPFPKIMI